MKTPARSCCVWTCRLQHLLVDEFQDTSQNQMELLCRLMAGWQAGEGRSLMVVGDPKQSIYGWRQAKPRLFAASSQGLPCPEARFPLDSLLLTTNFRATRTLIDWANAVFTDVLDRVPSLSFHAADPRPGATAGPVPKLALFPGSEQLSPREAEARWLARQVAEALPDLKEDETIGILLFTRTHLPVYLQALAAAGLTAQGPGGIEAGRQPGGAASPQPGPGPHPAPGRAGLGRLAPGALGSPTFRRPYPGGRGAGRALAGEAAALRRK